MDVNLQKHFPHSPPSFQFQGCHGKKKKKLNDLPSTTQSTDTHNSPRGGEERRKLPYHFSSLSSFFSFCVMLSSLSLSVSLRPRLVRTFLWCWERKRERDSLPTPPNQKKKTFFSSSSFSSFLPHSSSSSFGFEAIMFLLATDLPPPDFLAGKLADFSLCSTFFSFFRNATF